MLGKKVIFILVVSILTALPIMAQNTPSDVRDLVGARASSGESELQRRGYRFIKTTEGSDRKWSNWWNQRRKVCLSVVTMDGRYSSIVSTPSFDCEQSQNQDSDNKITPPRWAQGTFYGTAPNGTRITLTISGSGDVRAEIGGGTVSGSFIRGNLLSINGDQSRVTRQGSNIVTTSTSNGERIVYSRNGWGDDNSGGGKVNVSDLVGVRASSGESEMRSRGFRQVDSLKSGNTSYTIWWRQPSRQCIQVAVADGRYDSLTDIGTHPKCR